LAKGWSLKRIEEKRGEKIAYMVGSEDGAESWSQEAGAFK